MNMQTRQSGFTLVEIAIVLVIIGLLLGGILKGQEMITQARIKNVVNDLNGITAAYFSYQDRYKAIPGDDVAANTRWNDATAFGGQVTAGNGDGSVTGAYNVAPGSVTATTAPESLLFWWQLRAAGFVPGPTSGASPGAWSQPTNAVGGIVGAQNGAFITNPLTGNVVCTSNIPDKIAGAVDTQLDDQKSNAGSLRAQLGGGNPAANLAPATAYTETGNQQYLMCKSI
jgi:prepilin-type N-terminal cleavage/methylation domain-containing protein